MLIWNVSMYQWQNENNYSSFSYPKTTKGTRVRRIYYAMKHISYTSHDGYQIWLRLVIWQMSFSTNNKRPETETRMETADHKTYNCLEYSPSSMSVLAPFLAMFIWKSDNMNNFVSRDDSSQKWLSNLHSSAEKRETKWNYLIGSSKIQFWKWGFVIQL